ncbi:MAG: MBL fold metallo-hydrolase, partial [Bacilli bacterium]
MKYCVLASGSKGNMTYIETDQVRIFIDAGISYKEMKRRMPVNVDQIDAIFITHEHGDHMSGLITIA